ncbi:MAG: hypothetical protein AB2708_01480 [Candidatus Thiodiazotropha taylori]
MERIFISYTYNPVDAYKQETDAFISYIKIMIEAMGITILDGVDVGGWAIDAEIEKRINQSDALIAVMSPWEDAAGQTVIPPYVLSEFNIAHIQRKPTIRMIHKDLNVDGMLQNNEYIQYSPDNEVKVLLKLMRTIALWKQNSGRGLKVKIEPSEIGARYNKNDHTLQYQLLLSNYDETDWRDARLWKEPGATYAFIPNVPDDSKLRLKLDLRSEIWACDYSDGSGQIELKQWRQS